MYLAWKIDCSIEQWSSTKAIWLQPGDIIFIPNKTVDKVNIWIDQYIRRMIPLPIPIAVQI